MTELQRCAPDLDGVVRSQLPTLRDALSAAPDVDVWPILRVAGGDRHDVHDTDYVLLIDEAGDDTHLAGAGSNMLDLRRGHASYASRPGPARGCEQVFPDATSGGVERGPDGERRISSDPGPECVVSASLHVDVAADDTYGRLGLDGEPGGTCDGIARSVQGVGLLAGVGVLIDASGDDRYRARRRRIRSSCDRSTVRRGAVHVRLPGQRPLRRHGVAVGPCRNPTATSRTTDLRAVEPTARRRCRRTAPTVIRRRVARSTRRSSSTRASGSAVALPCGRVALRAGRALQPALGQGRRRTAASSLFPGHVRLDGPVRGRRSL